MHPRRGFETPGLGSFVPRGVIGGLSDRRCLVVGRLGLCCSLLWLRDRP